MASPEGRHPVGGVSGKAARHIIKFYKLAISPWLPGRCRFYPSCSEYAMECFQYLPFWKALGKSIWRIARCNPLSSGYFDPVFPEDNPEHSHGPDCKHS
ncbi:MAG: membrane protein insertion efficiency factor YidD [Spirochaetaceae bacterium]|nr:membrane protein insertion efficiency factor YidD [Spirochaetaceae bacterium]